MPREIFGPDHQFLERAELLSFEEIDHMAGVFVDLGIEKIRLTGGEPLVRRDVELLIEKLARHPQIDLTMTTNGSLLKQKAKVLKDAGLKRISVSLDSLDDDVFAAMNDAVFPVAGVLEGIDAARDAGFKPIKINMVVKRGVNEASILHMVRHYRGTGDVVRFIEFMDVGTTNGWRLDEVVPASEIVTLIHAEVPLEPVEQGYRGEVAKRYRYKDGGGEIGVIASVTQPFCGDCTRLRLSADGMLFTCLFATEGFTLRDLVRGGASDEEIIEAITSLWSVRVDRYSEARSSETTDLPKIEMSYIGG
jgi:cyclic pyranopterin phosphate synthase